MPIGIASKLICAWVIEPRVVARLSDPFFCLGGALLQFCGFTDIFCIFCAVFIVFGNGSCGGGKKSQAKKTQIAKN